MSHKDVLRFASCEPLEARRLLSVGSSYSAPTSPTTVVSEDPAWKFDLNPAGSPQTTSFSDSSWSTVTLPHTWDAAVSNDPTGDGWYRKTIAIPASMVGDEIYLQFEGASLSATVYVDGVEVGSHAGGWEAFDIDVTSKMTAGSHLVAVDVNNNQSANVLPTGGGDYIKEGGLYRDVSLVAMSKTHVALTEPVPTTDASGSVLAGSGVYFSNSSVTTGTASASVQIKTVLDNLATTAESVTVTSYLVSATGIIAAQQTSTQSLAAGKTDITVSQSAAVANPHLWAGRADPYLYNLYVEVRNASTGALLDLNHQQVGIRSFTISATAGFLLNGTPYKLVGVDMQQDSGLTSANGGPAGWAETDAQQQQDLNMVLALGATMVRTAHYTRDPAFYAYCDQTGLIVATEFGLNGNVTTTTSGSTTVVSPAFLEDAEDQLTEMIRQNYNHPSIITWGLFNEISSNSVNASLVTTLNTLAHSLDSTRDTVAETNSGGATDGINATPDAVSIHPYDGWYNDSPANLGSELDSYHNADPTHPMAVSEFGAGALIDQYTTNVEMPPSTTQIYNPENQQTQIEEEQWAEISSRSYLYADLVWSMFDFTDPANSNSDGLGENDKGLITRDRQTEKDLYYFYEANFNSPASTRGYATTAVVHISDHDWNERQGSPTVVVTAFSNVGAPTLTLNNGSSITMTQQVLNGITIPDAYTATVTLAAGANTIKASGVSGGKTYTDSTTWTYTAPATPGTGAVKINFQPADNGATAAGYLIDNGQVFGSRGNGQTYGWTTSNTVNAFRRNINSDPRYDTLIDMQQNGTYTWEDQLANGTYQVYIAAGDPSTTDSVQNLSVNGIQLFDTNGFSNTDSFTIDVTVTNGLLTIAPGVNSYNASLEFVEITPLESISGTVTNSGAGVAGITVYLDSNNNATLDTGEQSTTTNAQGVYDFSGLAAGTYIVRQILPATYVQNSPTDNYGIHVTLAARAYVPYQNFTDALAPSATIGGTISAAGSGFANVTVYLDANNNGTLDSGETSTLTNIAGAYQFTGLAAGTYVVRQVLPATYLQAAPTSGGGDTVTLAAGASATGENFTDAVNADGSISGSITDAGAGLANVTVYLDTNNNGTPDTGEPTAATSATGAYTFTGLVAGAYLVRQVVPTNYLQTSPAAGSGDSLTLTAGAAITNQNFADAINATGTIRGSITASGAALANVTVYLDANNNGKLDTGESSTLTSATGAYSFTGLVAGTYLVRQVVPAAYLQTSPAAGSGDPVSLIAGATAAGQNFADALNTSGSISGTIAAAGAGLANVTVYLDSNNNGALDPGEPSTLTTATGAYSFTGLAAGTFLVRQVVPTTYGQTSPAAGNGDPVTLAAGAAAANQNFTDASTSTASIAGTITAGEVGITNVTVYLDANNNATLDAGESTTLTDATGAYLFTGLPAGAYIVRQVLPPAYLQTAPVDNYGNHVSLNTGAAATGDNFTDVLNATGSISGTVTAAGVGLATVTVYLDTNNNGVLDPGESTALTSSTGAYQFTGLLPGTFVVQQVLPTGYVQTTPATGGDSVTLASGGASTNQNFVDALNSTGSIGGIVSTNGTGLVNVAVYLDTNNNGTLDTGEPTTLTDATGAYSFTGLPAGTYVVRQVVPATYTQATPAAGSGDSVTLSAGAQVTDIDFADVPTPTSSISGTVTVGGTGIANATVYIDSNNNGLLDPGEPTAITDTNGNYAFTGLAAGAYTIMQVLPQGYTQLTPAAGNGDQATLTAGASATNQNFIDAPNPTASISGTVTAGGAGLPNVTVYLDANDNGVLDAGESSALTDATGAYSFAGLPAGSYMVQQVVPPGYTQASPASGGDPVMLSAGGAATNQNFTDVQSPTGSISGTVTAAGAGVGNVTVYLDTNSNGISDAGELTTLTTATGAYDFAGLSAGSYTIRQVLPPTYTQSAPAAGSGDAITLATGATAYNQNFIDAPISTGTISGFVTGSGTGLSNITVYLDANNNSTFDAGELSTVTDNTGAYTFTAVPPGTYVVRQQLTTSYTQVSPASNYGNHATLASGGAVTNQNFADDAAAGSIVGTVFNDTNANGKQDASEAGLSGWEVYLDLNNTGAFTAADPSVMTDANGDFQFDDLAAGSYIVRVIRPPNYLQTTPTNNYGQHVALSATQGVAGIVFGEQLIN